MKKLFALALLGILSLSLLTFAMAETAAPAEETTVPAVETAPALDAAELDALLALNLENGKTFSAALEELGILDAFKAAQPREQIAMIHAQLLLGKLTQADALLLRDTLVKAVYGDAGNAYGRNFNKGDAFGSRGGRNGQQWGRQGGMMGRRGGMMGGWNGMMGGRGQCPAQDGTLCPNCPYAETTPEATVTP